MKRLFGRKKRKSVMEELNKAPADLRPGVYSDAFVWAVGRVQNMKFQKAPAV